MTRKNIHKIFSIMIALLVGISVPYFLIDITYKAYQNAVGVAPAEVLPNLGSNDIDIPIPLGETVPINPNTPGQYYFQGPNYQIPKTSAASYVVGDVDTGE